MKGQDRSRASAAIPGRVVAAAGILLLITAAVYWPVSGHGFVHYDDDGYVYENPHVRAGLTAGGAAWAFRATEEANWHPLTWLSHMLDCTLFGVEPGGHHLMNLALHLLNTLLLLLLMHRMTRALWPSLFVAAAFALHPLHVESVAWVAERKDVLSTLFMLLALFAYLRYTERPGPLRYGLLLAAFAAGLMAKPMVVTLPFLLLLLDHWPLRRLGAGRRRVAVPWEAPGAGRAEAGAPDPGWARLVGEKVPLLVLSAASCAVTYWVQQRGGAVAQEETFPFGVRAANALAAYLIYMVKAAVPSGLAVFYPHPGASLEAWKWIAAALVLSGFSVAAIKTARRFPYLLTGWFWYLGTLVPVIGLVQVGGQAMADRYTYMPLTGLFIMAAWGVRDLVLNRPGWKPFAKPLAAMLLIVLPAAMAFGTWRQVRHWADSEALFERALEVTEENHVAHNNLGIALAGRGERAEALRHFREALRIRPDYQDAHLNLAVVLAAGGDTDGALHHFEEAVRLDPADARAHYDYGNTLFRLGAVEEAIARYGEAVERSPGYVNARLNLGAALVQAGRPGEALPHLRQALEEAPDRGDARVNLALALAGLGRFDQAAAQCRIALKISPGLVQALDLLAWILATQSPSGSAEATEAVGLAKQACEATRFSRARMVDTLAAAHAAAGDFQRAVETAARAAALAEEGGMGDLASGIRTRMEGYRIQKPCRSYQR